MHRQRFESLANSIGYEGQLVNTLQVFCHYYGYIMAQLALAPCKFRLSASISSILSDSLLQSPVETSVWDVSRKWMDIENFISSLNVDSEGWTSCQTLNCIRALGLGMKDIVQPGINNWSLVAVNWSSSLIHPSDATARRKFETQALANAVDGVLAAGKISPESVVLSLVPGTTLSKNEVFCIHELVKSVHADTEDAILAYERGRQDERQKGKSET